MKITSPEGLQQPRPEKAYSKKDLPDSSRFDNALIKALEKPDLNGDGKKTSRLSEPRAIQGFLDTGSQTGYVDRTSRVISLMDAYASSLSNPRKTLKDIEPELSAFIEEAQHLHDEYTGAGNTNAELMSIMEDLLRAARLEGARFQRGDYLDPE